MREKERRKLVIDRTIGGCAEKANSLGLKGEEQTEVEKEGSTTEEKEERIQ